MISRKKALGFLLAVIFVSGSCSDNGEERLEPEIRPVYTMVLEQPDDVRERSFSGVASAVFETRLSFRVSGEIVELPVQIGTKVHKGDLIGRLDPTDYELQLKQAKAQLAQANAKYRNAKEEHERTRSLYETGNASKRALDQARTAFESGQANREAAQKAVKLAEKQLQYTTLRAPVEGTIGSVPVELYQTVQSGQLVATLNSEDKIEMQVGIPAALISQVRTGGRAAVSFDVIPSETFEAQVSEVGIVTTETTTYPVKLLLLEQDRRIRPGMVGEARFRFESKPEERYVLVPPSAVVGRPNEQHFMWVIVTGTNGILRARRRQVEIGQLTASGLQIVSGIEPGERIATRGVHRLENNMRVRLMEEE